MANAPLRQCNEPGCTELVRGRWKCDKHRKHRKTVSKAVKARRDQEYNAANVERRREAWRFYAGKKWRKVRQYMLNKYPGCMGADCNRLADVVDHVVDRLDYDGSMYDVENLQCLCKPCHDRKTMATHVHLGDRGKGGR